MNYIDLRSDTVTKPTQKMRDAMYKAPVDDDVYGDDQLMNELEDLVARKLGKEAGIFVPSGTFSNQLSLFTHCNQGDEVIVDQFAHIVQHEAAASSVIASVQLFTLESNEGIWDLDKLEKMIRVRELHSPATKLICIENAYNGRVLPLEYMESVYNIAKKHKISVHLDGARIFNAATALKCDVSEIAKYADTISVCLSKGLGAPIGTVLVGSKDFIDEARLNRKLMGGGMRQVGILAACGKIAVEEMSLRLKEDHENAEYMCTLLEEIDGIKIDYAKRDINMVYFDIDDERKYKLHKYMFERGIKVSPWEDGFRFATHFDLSKNDIKKAIELVKIYFN